MSFQAGSYRISPNDDVKRTEFRNIIHNAMDRIHSPPIITHEMSTIINSDPCDTYNKSKEERSYDNKQITEYVEEVHTTKYNDSLDKKKIFSPTFTLSDCEDNENDDHQAVQIEHIKSNHPSYVLNVEDILGMDKIEVEELRREKNKWKIEKDILFEKIVDLENINRSLKRDKNELECTIQQVIEHSDNEVNHLRDEINKMHHTKENNIHEFDVESELEHLLDYKCGPQPAPKKDIIKRTIDTIASLQLDDEVIVAICSVGSAHSSTNCFPRFTFIFYIITNMNVYITEIVYDPQFSITGRSQIYRYYEFNKPLIAMYYKIFKSFGSTTFDCGCTNDHGRNGIDPDIFHSKIKSIIHAIPGTQYSPLVHPWKKMKTPNGSPVQYINTDTMQITTNPPYVSPPIQYE